MKKLLKGSRLDELPPDNPEGSWRLAKNMVNYKRFGGLSNENGADPITPVAVPATDFKNFPVKPVIGIIPITSGSVFFFSPSGAGSNSEIGIVDDQNRYRPIVIDKAAAVILDFHIDSPIQGTYEHKFNENLIIAWRDSRNNPRILNLDCLPFEVDSSFNVVAGDVNKAKALIKLFPDVATPSISDLSLADNGGALKTGTYFPIVSYELADKSVTSWLKVYNPFPVVQDSSTVAFKDFDGDFADVLTSKRLEMDFADIDQNYLNLRFGVIILQSGQYTAYYIASFKINGSTLSITYTGNESTITPITLDNVLIPNAIYTRANTITNLLGKLYLGGVEKRQQISYQQYANMIEVEWVRGDYINLNDNHGNSYKDEKIIFFDKSFRSDEVAALYIFIKYKDGTYSDGFHIPGREALAGDTDIITGDAEVDKLDTNVPKFRIRETALLDGTMGYWENDSEVYPDTDDFDSSSLGGLDLRGLPVRHHKFPEIATIVKGGEAYFKKFIKDAGQLVLNDPITNDATPTVGFSGYEYNLVSNTTTLTHATTGLNDFNELTSTVLNRVIQIRGTIEYDITGIQPSGAGDTVIITAYIMGNDAQQYLVETVTITYSMTGGTGNYTGSLDFNRYWILFAIGDIMNIGLIASTPHASIVLDFTGTELTVEEGTQEAAARPLGIRVSNVNIPSSILNEVDSWEIAYAKRTNSNIRLIGQDVAKEERLHTFDLVYNQANVRGDFVKPQVLFQRNSLTSLSAAFNNYLANPVYEFITDGVSSDITALDTFFYVGENTLSPIDNTGKSTSIYIEPIWDETNEHNVLFDIHIYRRDVYKSFDSQVLVSTGKAFKITASGVQATQDIYGGDTFISQFGFIEDIAAKNEYLIPHESAANIGLRMDDEVQTPNKYYYPKHVAADPTPPDISFYGYNSDFTVLNDLNKIFPKSVDFDDCNSDVYIFPGLIAYSIDDADESLKLGWRIFPVNNYYDRLPRDKGRLWNLLGTNRTLYIQQEYTLLIAEVKDKLTGSGSEEIVLGVTEIFSRPPIEILPTTEGYVGSQCQFATLMTPMGYVTIDRQKGKVFVFDKSQGLKEISSQGYYNYFKDNAQTTIKTTDNPYAGNGYTAAYDLELRRLIIVKKSSAGEFTLSYSPEADQGRGAWISFHDYHPHYIFSTRNGLYAGVNTDFKLYKHNSATLKGIFYNATMYRSYVDVPFNQAQNITKVFGNFNWITHVRTIAGVMREDETLTNLMVYNNNQCSGDISLQADGGIWYGKDAKNTEETWNFNKFRDLINDKNSVFLDANGDLITSNINNNKPWFDRNKFISKFVIVRFGYDNVNQRDIYIVSVDSNLRQSNR